MKDLLGRDIIVGDKIARALSNELEIYTVTNTSDFALQLRAEATGDTPEYMVLVGDPEVCVICDWAR
jgi:hypothetical protein